MPDLSSFIAEQERQGRVVRIPDELDPVHEAGRVLSGHEGHIVILENVRGYRVPVVGGVVSSRELFAAAIGCERGQAVEILGRALDAPRPVTKVGDAPFLHGLAPTTDVDTVVPLLTFRPGAEQPYTTASIVAARSARCGMNLSFHRLMYLGKNRFSIRIVPRHLRMIVDEGQGSAEVCVLVGVHPAVSLAAATSAAPEFDELEMAAALLGGLEVVDLDGLTVPAHTELVLRGRITGELAPEGPFVDLTGTLDGVRQEPVVEISAIYRRPDYLYQTIVPGGREHRLLMGCPQEPRIFRAVSNAVPCLAGVALTSGGANWLHAVVALSHPRAGQARNAALAALGAHPSLKRVVVVDEDIDPEKAEEVEWAIATRVRPAEDVIVVPGCRGSSLDPSRNPADDTTAKWIIDATIPPGRDRSEYLRAETAHRE
jgi:UbiD family decarboxylase